MPRPRLPEARLAWAVELGQTLRAARVGLGLSREAVARLAGTSVGTLAKIESAQTRSPEFYTVTRIALVLGQDLNRLAGSATSPVEDAPG